MFSTGDFSTFQAQWLASTDLLYIGKGRARKTMRKTPRGGGRLAERVTAMAGYVAVAARAYIQLRLQSSGLILGEAL